MQEEVWQLQLMKNRLPETIPTRNLLIEDLWGEYNIRINKDLCIESFVDEIINNTIPYIECHRKCPAQSKCPYATEEARCEVQQLALRNFFKYAGTEVDLTKRDILLRFTKSAIFYSKLVFDSFTFAYGAIEEWTWKRMTKLYLRYPFYSSHPLIESGDRFVDLITGLIPNAYMQKILLVEGKCEEIIFKKLFMKPKYSHPRFDRIENMKGEGNFRRIELLLKELRKQHFKIHILADGDGHMANVIERLRKRSLIKRCEYTIFSKALEDAFPRNMIIDFFKKALPKQLAQLIAEAAQSAWSSRSRSFCKELKKALIESGVTAKEADKVLSTAKIIAASAFAEALDDKIFRSPTMGLDRNKHEILRVTYKLFTY
ncbi:MAG: TOPRIM nucleotidyl transferase/hydrolase domain-containing protein [bacterium]